MFDWHRKLQTSHTPPRHADLLPDDPIYPGFKRVAIMGDYQVECARTNPQYDASTNWHYAPDGTLPGDASGEWRLVEA